MTELRGTTDLGDGSPVQGRATRDFLEHFDAQVQACPDAICVATDSLEMTYGEVADRSKRFAQRLREAGVQPHHLVGLCLDRSPELAISLLAILKTGAAYLPLDPRYPPERLSFMAADAQLPYLICSEKYQGLFETSNRVVFASPTATPIGKKPTEAVEVLGATRPLGYVIYTSGSTGKPKGVALGRAALSNLIDWQITASPAGQGTRTVQFTPISFDVHFQEFFGTWCSGGTLYLIGEEERLEPDRLIAFLKRHDIQRIFLPYVALAALAEMSEATGEVPDSLRETITAGEQLKVTSLLRNFFAKLPGCTLANHYGPSETHVVTAHVLSGSPSLWPDLPPIGTAIPNVRIHLLDDQRQPVPPGQPGELYISGVALADGYLHRSELTAERFVTVDATRMYRSGDLGRVLTDGNIEFLGRADHQVKIRGYRIEPGEIEVALAAIPGVRQAVVLVRDLPTGDRELAAYLLPQSQQQLDLKGIEQQLRTQLPDYMIPARFQVTESFPKTPSGKVDRKALPSLRRQRPDRGPLYQPPASATETLLCQMWEALLDIEPVGTNDNFFELGGNSLLAIHCISKLRTDHAIELPVAALYDAPTVAGLARRIDPKEVARHQSTVSPSPGGGDIAIVGMACQFPGARDLEALWANLCAGVESISFFQRQDLDSRLPAELTARSDYVPARGLLVTADQFDPAFFGMTPREAELMDPQQRLFLETAWQALEDAGHSPSSFTGKVGVFGGTHNNSYYRGNVLTRPDLVAGLGDFPTMVGNEKDYVATRVAHKLDLHGPAMTIQTACSTSLVAVAMAVQSLQSGQCDMALAGGAAVTVPQHSGHLYQEGGMLSPDGHCRPFDADAKGTVFSDGVGLVVLRPLGDAVRDGDRIYAVIKGAAVNNDGGEKASFSAPSVRGQADVITTAQTLAAVDPSTIGYVEAHGTATPLGDPIEVEALKQAFQAGTDRKQYCALGSIKSNFGHLTAAAGIAGLIKAALALANEQLPPTVHFQSPNEAIEFANSPFFVNEKLRPWKRASIPRRAAVSSFGVGGTNAHVVLEDAPAFRETPSPRPAQLVLLSARSLTSLDRASSNLADFVKRHPALDLADVAFTLQEGRARFSHRRAVVARDLEDIRQQLELRRPPRVLTGEVTRGRRKVVFLFSGQGSQSPNMTRSLYRIEPVFREAMDRCLEIMQPLLGYDLRPILFPGTSAADVHEPLNDTANTQPALFAVEYALAQLWQSWGIEPEIVLGHSIGEYVAACLAGVFTLEDALRVVTIRGREMQRLPRGSMLSVRLSAEEIAKRLRGTVTIAADNAPQLCVVSGPSDEIELLRQTLEADSIPATLLQTSHAFHSAMMEPLVETFRDVVASVPRCEPSLPIISTVTGRVMSPAEAMSPDYWATQLRLPVEFRAAIQTAWSDPSRILLEVGPRSALTTLARQQIDDPKTQLAVASLESVGGDDQEWESLLRAIGQLWIHGIDLRGSAFYRHEQRQRISLPTYPFERKRCWVDPLSQPVHKPTINTEETMPASRIPELQRKLADLLEEVSGIDVGAFEPSASFLEMGLDSLLLTQIATAIERRFKIKLTFRQLIDQFTSVELLADYLDTKLAPSAVAPPLPPSIPPTSAVPDVVATAAVSTSPVPADASVLERIFAQQLEVMRRQLDMLQGTSSPVTSLVAQAVSSPATSPSSPPADAATETAKESKPFGAAARIKLTTARLDDRQRQGLQRITERYCRRTKRSKEMAQQNRGHLADPRVVSGFRPETKEIVYPIVVERSKGARLWDVDGNEYVDLTCGFGSNFFGNSADFIVEAIERQLKAGYEIGPQHVLAGTVARGICELTGSERAALCNTGSEAVLGALRLARTVTGRNTVAMFTGAYHGIVDEVIVRAGRSLRSMPAAPGIPPSAVENVLVLDYDSEESLAILRERADDLAAVLVEPVQSRRPELQPRAFLHALRELTTASGSALIFDEVITGFRIHPGGAQAHFGVRADLATYGKVIGGGMPIGVIAGRHQFMDALDGGSWQYGDESFPAVGVTYLAGTFVRHPLALAAAKAVIDRLQREGTHLHDHLNAKTTAMVADINVFLEQRGAPIHLDNFGSLFKVHYTEEQPYGELLYTLLRDRGVHIWDARPCFLTTAHTDSDIEQVKDAFRQAVLEMQAAGFLPPGPERLEQPEPARNGKAHESAANAPPVPGARLGRDPRGKPAWYVSDPARPGKYIQVGEAV